MLSGWAAELHNSFSQFYHCYLGKLVPGADTAELVAAQPEQLQPDQADRPALGYHENKYFLRYIPSAAQRAWHCWQPVPSPACLDWVCDMRTLLRSAHLAGGGQLR